MGGLFGGGSTISTSDVKLGGLRIQQTGYGKAIPIVYGSNRITPNLIDYTNFRSIAHTTTQSSGGKGGVGGSSSNTTYTYTAAVCMGLCEGPVAAFGALWLGKNTFSSPAQRGLSLFAGSYPQSPWGWMQTYHPERAIGYQGIAYGACANYDLGGNASLGNHSFEVIGVGARQNGADVNALDVVADFLNNVNYGAMFPYLGSIAAAWNYCQANGLFISPVIDTQKPAHEWLAQLVKIANAALVWSEGVLKVIPYGDQAVSGNGASYTPNTTPIYDLTDDDFIADGQKDPIEINRKKQADAFNYVQVEFLNRVNQYNVEPAEAKDQANIEAYGLRAMSPVKLQEVCVGSVAKLVAQTMLQRELYIRNTYIFTLTWKYCLLEPMDIVSLTDAALGLNQTPVRITEIDESYEGLLTITAEELPYGVSQPAQYAHPVGSGYQPNYNADAGIINAPVIFEAPDLITQTGLEIWIAASGGAGWGGCEVWVSRDDATYKKVGTIHGSARHGVLSANLPASVDPDKTSVLAVDVSISAGTLIGGTQADADAFNTLCYVDGEFISFQSATLTGTGKYNLGTYLRRGAFNTAILSHPAGAQFARLDQAIFKYAFTADMIGLPLYIKLPSFNQFGGGQQTLDTVQSITYNISGYSLKSPLPNVVGLVDIYRNSQTLLSWQPVVDFRAPITYEVRIGDSWTTALILGATSLTEFMVSRNGTYWVSARYTGQQGIVAYSGAPTSILIAGGAIPANYISAIDEAATGWAGACTLPAFYDPVENAVKLGGSALFSAITAFAAENSIEYYGGIASGGYYQIPASHEVDIGVAQLCSCMVELQASADSPFVLFSAVPLLSAQLSVAGNYAGKAGVQIEIDTAQNDGVWQGWRNFMAGQYFARKYRVRALLTSGDTTVSAIIHGLLFSVDVPDRVNTGTAIAAPAAGLAVAFTTPFHVAPNVQITILNPLAGDVIAFPVQPTTTGFTVQITNGGFGVARNINWLAKAY